MIRQTAPARSACVGDTFSAGPRVTGFAEWNRFAAVNDEFVPMHMDDDHGRAAGYPGAIGMGRLQWSYLHNLLRAWLDDNGRILSIAVRYRAPFLRHSTFDTKARVTAICHLGGQRVIDCDVWIEDAHGVVLAPGTATVSVAVRLDQR